MKAACFMDFIIRRFFFRGFDINDYIKVRSFCAFFCWKSTFHVKFHEHFISWQIWLYNILHIFKILTKKKQFPTTFCLSVRLWSDVKTKRNLNFNFGYIEFPKDVNNSFSVIRIH